jgi:uncharacterized protein YecT (DUF1311 family)
LIAGIDGAGVGNWWHGSGYCCRLDVFRPLVWYIAMADTIPPRHAIAAEVAMHQQPSSALIKACRIFGLMVVCWLSGTTQSAQAQPVDCAKATATTELNYCSLKEFEAADVKLNEAYRRALADIRESRGDKPYDRKSWEMALQASQKAWIAFRDADCNGLVPMSWGGGTGTTSAVLGCNTTKTELRTKELVAIFNN